MARRNRNDAPNDPGDQPVGDQDLFREELELLRTDQRRAVRALPPHAFVRASELVAGASRPPRFDAETVEMALRRAARDVELSQPVNEAIDHQTRLTLRRFVLAQPGALGELPLLDGIRGDDESARDWEAAEAGPPEEAVLRFVVLALLADAAAGDGYIDPRSGALR